MKILGFSLLVVGALGGLLLLGTKDGEADSIVLKNGQTIHGKARRENGKVIVDFGERGWLSLHESAVEKIVENALDEFTLEEKSEETGGRAVTVTLKDGSVATGKRTFTGRLLPSEDEGSLALELADGVVLKASREDVESVVETEEAAAPPTRPEEVERTIRTTHVVTLKNGRRIQGNVVNTPEGEPVEVRLGDLGTLRIPRRQIEKIEVSEGVYELPAPSPEPEIQPEEVIEEIPVEEIKRQVREEILRELLQDFIERKVDDAIEYGIRDISLESIPKELDPETILDAQYYVRELCRQRTQNRVRAERHLKSLGVAALPYLDAAATHPFDLARRAVQRIVRAVGDVRATPYAIEALDDEDFFVRQLAGEALDTLIGADIAYNPSWPRKKLEMAQEAYRRLWDGIRRAHLEALVHASLARS